MIPTAGRLGAVGWRVAGLAAVLIVVLIAPAGLVSLNAQVTQSPPAGSQPAAGGNRIDMDQLEADEALRLGVVRFHDGFFTEAIVAFQRALSLKPDFVIARYWLGRAYFHAGFIDAAKSEWQSLVDAGLAGAALRGFIETIDARAGVFRDLPGDQSLVVNVEIAGNRGDRWVFRRPAGVASAGNGGLYVTSFADNAIVRLDANGAVAATYRGGILGFDGPFDIERVDGHGLFVSEFNADRIALVGFDGAKVATFGGTGSELGRFLGPQQLVATENGFLFVVDVGNRRVQKLAFDGRPLLAIGSDGPGRLNRPAGIAAIDGEIFVGDNVGDNAVIRRFDYDGNFLGTVGGLGLARIETIVAADDSVYLSDGARLYRYDSGQQTALPLFEATYQRPRIVAIGVDDNANLVGVDFDNSVVFYFSPLRDIASGLHVQIQRVNASQFPTVRVEFVVENRAGRPLVGLEALNFVVTEARRPVGPADVVYQGNAVAGGAVVAVFERSDRTRNPEINRGYERLIGEFAAMAGGNVGLWVVSADQTATVEARPGAGAAAYRRAATVDLGRADWSIDAAIRLAAQQTLRIAERRSIVFVGRGSVPDHSFATFGLMETAAFLRNNQIRFSFVSILGEPPGPEVRYLVDETGGRVIGASDPAGVRPLIETLLTVPNGRYAIEYESQFDSDFGRRYLPVEIEAILVKKSGRDESGYFGPLEF